MVCVLDLAGLQHLRDQMPSGRVRSIFFQPPPANVLAARMQARGSTPEEIALRLALQAAEKDLAQECDFIISTDAPYEEVLRRVMAIFGATDPDGGLASVVPPVDE